MLTHEGGGDADLFSKIIKFKNLSKTKSFLNSVTS